MEKILDLHYVEIAELLPETWLLEETLKIFSHNLDIARALYFVVSSMLHYYDQRSVDKIPTAGTRTYGLHGDNHQMPHKELEESLTANTS